MTASSPRRIGRDRLADLERLAARVEVELRRERAARAERGDDRRGPGRPSVRGPDDHGTERDYQAEAWAHRKRGAPPPCEVCKAAHSLHNQRAERERRRLRPVTERPYDAAQLTIFDVIEKGA